MAETLDNKTNPKPAQPAPAQPAQPTQPVQTAHQQEQKLKATKAMSNAYEADKFMNVQLALLDEDETERTHFNQEKDMKIVCFFVPKIYETKNLYQKDSVVKIPYSIVDELTIEDRLDSIGVGGYVNIKNDGNALEGIFERHNNYYFVVNITEYVGDVSIKYEPYIFDIVSVTNITKPFKKDKVVRIQLVDIITSILSSHSIASFIKFEGTEVANCKNYKVLFSKIINYVKRFIRINNNNVYEFKKDVIYDESMMFMGKNKLNGYDADLDVSALVTASFNKIERNSSIYEAMKVFLVDCVTSIKMTDEMKSIFQEIGDVLIPFFFKEEYADVNGIYYNLWHEEQPELKEPKKQGENANNEEKLQGKELQESKNKISRFKEISLSNPDYAGKSERLVLRNITMRDFFMPFYLCFSYKSNGGPFIWEDINPKSSISTLNGSMEDNLQSLTFRAIDKRSVDKRWKNVVFLDGSVEQSGVKHTMVFFDWFYKFFLRAFLNSSLMGGENNYISNVIPDFYAFSGANKIGYAENSNEKTFNNLFDEYNSNTIALTTTDTINESLRAMGKNLASLVLLNDSYMFSLKGNLLRRPNEIVRLSIDSSENGGEQQLNIFTNNNTLFVYLRQVTHVFKGTTYTNNIVASKICEAI